MERRAERFVKRIVEKKGELLETKPKKVKRVAGKVISKVKHTITRNPEIDERTHKKEHEDLDQLDLKLHRRKRKLKTTSFGQVDTSLSSQLPRHVLVRAEAMGMQSPDPDFDWSPDHSSGEEVPIGLWEDRLGGKHREEKELEDEPLSDQND